MNTFMNGLKDATNFAYTENGAITHRTTKSDLLDMFALGGAYRNRSDEDCILLFKKALEENEVYALKCLFYLRDVRGGQGERRFWRVCMKWLAKTQPEVARRNLIHTALYGRWDDLYVFVGTPLEKDALQIMKDQLELDVQCKTPSLLAKWMKSENTSSRDSKYLGSVTRKFLGMNHKQYRKTLAILRARINVLERLMSENRWDEIEFDKIPSKAGMKYKNAFARHDIERAKTGAQTYADFAKDETKKVNAKTLYPYECVEEAFRCRYNETQRLMTNKYWDNLADYINNATFNGMAIVDTSGSMSGTPMNVAISLGMYCAEKAQGPFANHFITFESNPHFMEIEGVDFCDKVWRISRAPWGGSTNIEAAFDLMLNIARSSGCSQDEIPQNLIIISDMEFDSCVTSGPVSNDRWGWGCRRIENRQTLMETIEKRWNAAGYKMPNLVFWNVDARSNNIPMTVKDGISFVSGFSPAIFEQIMSGKTAFDLMYEVLNKERYACIR